MSGLQKYQAAVKNLLNCSEEEKNWYLSRLDDALEGKGDLLSFEEISAYLGSPEEWAASRVDNDETAQSITEIKKRKDKARNLKIAGLILVLFIVSFVVYFILWKDKHGGAYGFYSTAYDPVNIESQEGK